MNAKGRIESSFQHEAPDRTPFFEYCLNSKEITRRVLGRDASYLNWDDCLKEKGWEGAVRQIAVDRLDIAEFFGHDMMYITRNPGPPVDAPPSTVREDSIDDPVEKVAKRNRQRKGDGAKISEDGFLVYKLINDEMEKRGINIPILVPAYSHGVWTDIDLMQTMVLDPDVAKEHFKIATENTSALIDKYLELGIKLIGIGGDFAGNAPLISPDCYKEFIMPELKVLSDKIHENGACAVNASDGNLWSVIDYFLIGSGVDGYLEIDLHAGMELKKLKDGYGDKITFLGNMDCGNTLSFASPEDIRRETVKCLEDGLGSGGHIFTASNAITDSVPVENYFAMVNAYKDFWKQAKLEI